MVGCYIQKDKNKKSTKLYKAHSEKQIIIINNLNIPVVVVRVPNRSIKKWMPMVLHHQMPCFAAVCLYFLCYIALYVSIAIDGLSKKMRGMWLQLEEPITPQGVVTLMYGVRACGQDVQSHGKVCY